MNEYDGIDCSGLDRSDRHGVISMLLISQGMTASEAGDLIGLTGPQAMRYCEVVQRRSFIWSRGATGLRKEPSRVREMLVKWVNYQLMIKKARHDYWQDAMQEKDARGDWK